MRLRVHYELTAELLADADAQFQHGGVLVRMAIPAGLSLFDPVELEISTAFAGTVVVNGQVVQLVPGAGVAVTFDPRVVAPLVDAARGTGPASGPATAGARARGGPPPAREVAAPPDEPAGAGQRSGPHGSDTASRIHAALYGNRDERGRIIRDLNKMLHPYVLKNVGLGLDEVLAIAKMTTVAPDLLAMIADRREWAQRADIAIALVRNPKTPVAAAIRLLDSVTPAELRQLAKDSRTRPAIQQAARKKVLG